MSDITIDTESNINETKDEQSSQKNEAPHVVSPDPLKDLFQKWAHYFKQEKEPFANQTVVRSGPSIILIFLKILPYFTLGAFGASIWFDPQGFVNLPWRQEAVSYGGLLRMLAVSGLIGFSTNWLAIKMLFYPRQRRPLLGQGLIPSKKDKIVLRLSESISKEIINSELIAEQIQKSDMVNRYRQKLNASLRDVLQFEEFRSDIMSVIQHYTRVVLRSKVVQERIDEVIDHFAAKRMKGIEGGLMQLFMLFWGDMGIKRKIREAIDAASNNLLGNQERFFVLLDHLPDSIDNHREAIERYTLNVVKFLIDQIDVEQIIYANLGRFDEVRLERLLMRSTSDQLQYIQYLGCLLGIIGGLFIWLPLESVILFGSLALLVYLADISLIALRNKPKE